MKTYGFPGQGSQKRGMGLGLFSKFPIHTKLADEILGYSIEDLCLEDPERKLSNTQYTQPALFVVNALHYLQHREVDADEPDVFIGHSLGEYNALMAAGAFSFETGLRLVKRRGELMATAPKGGMAAIIGADASQVAARIEGWGLKSLDVANYNGPEQVVIAGPQQSLEEAEALFTQTGATYIMLNVSAPFHSRYMEFMVDEYRELLHQLLDAGDKYPVIANTDARPYEAGCLVQNLASQIVSPVRWAQSIRSILNCEAFDFVELGPGRVLTSLVEKILKAGPETNVGPQENKNAQTRCSGPEQMKRVSASHNTKGRLHGKVGLITGGTSGIGAATVQRFVEEGARVAIVGRNANAGADAVQRFGSENVCFIEADVAQEGAIKSAVDQTIDWGGRLDVLFNNAGGLVPGGVEDLTQDDFDYSMSLILGSVLFGIRHAVPVMKKQGWGTIINNSSIAALRSHMGGYLYSVAKAAVSHATRMAGMELGPYGITVNSVSPGAVITPLFVGGSRVAAHMPQEKTRNVMDQVGQSLSQATPLARAGAAEDVAAAVVFLASDEGHYINCHDLVVDGGLTIAGRGNFNEADLADPLLAARKAMSRAPAL